MAKKAFTKFSPEYYGSFEVFSRVGTISYRLQLPTETKIHDVFHVSLLKKHMGDLPDHDPTLPPVLHGRAVPLKPLRLIKARVRGDAR